ncbi:MAG: DegV family EDD domain-containing protein [Bacilli bacterium]|nr:DegV family EDD domain-containing protein [Bacilli bacterium]
MEKVILTVDSGICAKKKENTIIIPAQIVTNDGNSYRDDGQISNKQILNDMKKGIIYKTSSPLLGDFEDAFRKILEEGKDVIHLSMGSGISSGSVNGSMVIANELNKEYENNVYVIDTLTGATGGTLLYELAYKEMINSSLSTTELVDRLNELKKKIKTSFYVPSIEGYVRSGRDKSSSHLKDGVKLMASHLAKFANFKFRVDFHENGDLFLKKIFRSTEVKGMEKMVKEIVNDKTIENFDPSFVAIGSLYKDKINIEKIKEYLLSFKYFNEVIENDIGSVVAAYGCNDLSGIALIKKR